MPIFLNIFNKSLLSFFFFFVCLNLQMVLSSQTPHSHSSRQGPSRKPEVQQLCQFKLQPVRSESETRLMLWQHKGLHGETVTLLVNPNFTARCVFWDPVLQGYIDDTLAINIWPLYLPSLLVSLHEKADKFTYCILCYDNTEQMIFRWDFSRHALQGEPCRVKEET